MDELGTAKLRTQVLELRDRTRVEIALEVDGPQALAVNAYDDPAQALREATAFMESALEAVRAEALRLGGQDG